MPNTFITLSETVTTTLPILAFIIIPHMIGSDQKSLPKQLASFKKVNRNIEELSTIVQRHINDLAASIQTASKMRGRQKLEALEQLSRKDYKALKNLVNSFQIAVSTQQAENEVQDLTQLQSKYEYFQKALQKFRRDIDFFRTEKVRQQQVFAVRAAAAGPSKEGVAFEIEAAQKQSETAVQNMLRILYETNEIACTVNVQLQRQINELDSIGDNIRDTETLMNRAMRHINYFARSIYTDKLLIALMVLILVAVLAIVVLNVMGKVSTSSHDSLT